MKLGINFTGDSFAWQGRAAGPNQGGRGGGQAGGKDGTGKGKDTDKGRGGDELPRFSEHHDIRPLES